MRFHVKDGYGQRHSDLTTSIMSVTTVCVLGSGILYLSETVHAPVQPSTIFYDPAGPPASHQMIYSVR
jgi:hypothetical protein